MLAIVAVPVCPRARLAQVFDSIMAKIGCYPDAAEYRGGFGMDRHLVATSARTNRWFTTMAQTTAKLAGSSPAFIAICGITLMWLVTGPIFQWSDTTRD